MGKYSTASIICFFLATLFCVIEAVGLGLILLIVGFVFLFMNIRQKKAGENQTPAQQYPPQNGGSYRTYDNGTVPPSYGNGAVPPYGNGTVRPPYGNGTVQPPYGNGTVQPSYGAVPRPPQYPYTPPIQTPQRTARNVEAYFAGLLQNSFAAYTVHRNVPGERLSTPQWTCKCGSCNTTAFCPHCGATRPNAQYEKINFLLLRDNVPMLAILLVTRRKWNTRSIRNTIEACERAGIPWQRYFVEYDNEYAYVIDRINGAIR